MQEQRLDRAPAVLIDLTATDPGWPTGGCPADLIAATVDLTLRGLDPTLSAAR